MPRFVDLSAPIAPSPEGTPEFLATGVDFFSHADGAAEIEGLFGVPARLLRDGEGWTRETITNLGTHNSTHVDAPYHYNSTIRGEPAQTIDQLPLDWFFAPGVVLDFTGRDDGDAVRAEELEPALAAAGHELRERDIVLVRTDCDRFYAEPDYMFRGPGVTAEATEWLFDRGVRVMGIDAWGWDRPLNLQAAEALERDEPGVFWAAHQCGSAVLADRAAVQPGGATADGLHGRVLPAEAGRCERRAGTRGRDGRLTTWAAEQLSGRLTGHLITLDTPRVTTRGGRCEDIAVSRTCRIPCRWVCARRGGGDRVACGRREHALHRHARRRRHLDRRRSEQLERRAAPVQPRLRAADRS